MARKTSAKTEKSDWTRDWSVGIRVWVERSGHALLGEGRAELLAAIDQERSITNAAKTAGMSYRRAWDLIQAMNKAAGAPLVEAAPGGARGGGAQLTPRGRVAVEIYQQVHKSLTETAAGVLQRTVDPHCINPGIIHLAAAISLQEAVGQILAEYALRQPATQVRAIFGASNELADHLVAGAPGDVFISAEPAELDRLSTFGLILPRSRRTFARNGLAFVGRPTMKDVTSMRELGTAKFRRIAVAEPTCPLGNHSRSFFERAGIYESIRSKALFVDNSRAVLAAVVSGAADVGLAFSSDASRPGSWQTLFHIPTSRTCATYEAALVGRSQNVPPKLLMEFMTSPVATRCLRRCGLQPVSKK
jgi:molybdate transport system regulatory protein